MSTGKKIAKAIVKELYVIHRRTVDELKAVLNLLNEQESAEMSLAFGASLMDYLFDDYAAAFDANRTVTAVSIMATQHINRYVKDCTTMKRKIKE